MDKTALFIIARKTESLTSMIPEIQKTEMWTFSMFMHVWVCVFAHERDVGRN